MIPLPLYPPPPIEARCAGDDAPSGFLWRRRWRMVATVEARWRETQTWWQEDSRNRAYYRVVARDGLRCVVFRDLETGNWHMHAVMD